MIAALEPWLQQKRCRGPERQPSIIDVTGSGRVRPGPAEPLSIYYRSMNESEVLTLFRRTQWLRRLNQESYESVSYMRGGIFYTGTIILGSAVPLTARERLSRIFGSSTHIFVCHRGERSNVTS